MVSAPRFRGVSAPGVSRRVGAAGSPVQQGPAQRCRRVFAGRPIEAPAPHPAQVRLGRAVAPNVDARVGAGQATLGPGQLDPRDDLLLGGVAAQARLCRVLARGLGELIDPGCELGQGSLESVEPVALDASPGPDGEGPGGYLRLR